MNHHSPVIAVDQPLAKQNARKMPMWARAIIRRFHQIEHGTLTVSFPQSSSFHFAGSQPGPDATLHIKSSKFLWTVVSGGSLGFAKAYMDDLFETPDLNELLSFGIANEKELRSLLSIPLATRFVANLNHYLRSNTIKGSRRNIAFHYDLGNEFYSQWLDETMTYSSAIFDSETQSLAEAQNAKYDRIIKALNISKSDRVLEIGCGWGGFAEYAAREIGCEIVGLTLSIEQAAFARARLERAGLDHLVVIRIEDYRACHGQFDKIVSIEMFEAVGESNWPVYFAQLNHLLVDGGEAMLQVITIHPDRFQHYRKTADFIQTYIFPGGMLPSNDALITEAKKCGFHIRDQFMFGNDYAETLVLWDELFQERWSRIAPLGFDERFKRMWRYYFHYCAVGFRTNRIDVGQFHFRKD
jgi:cyclopropane-fatty-acyl-phospholipid synthase